MNKELLSDATSRMHGAVDSLDHDLAGFRTGRASTALVDRLNVDYYGTLTPLGQMATITTPEPSLIVIRPWDQSQIQAIEKAIMASELGLNPSSDGQVVRLSIPMLTEERREELVKMISKRGEEARVAVRNVRRDVLHHLDDLELPEDEAYGNRDEIQKLTDKHIAEIDAHLERKVAEVREV